MLISNDGSFLRTNGLGQGVLGNSGTWVIISTKVASVFFPAKYTHNDADVVVNIYIYK